MDRAVSSCKSSLLKNSDALVLCLRLQEAREKRTRERKRRAKIMTDEEIIKAVRWRYRICNYLFRLGVIWILVAVVGGILAPRFGWDWPQITIELIGLALLMSGGAMTLAIYRCPACDRYLNKYRPDKERCTHCGAKVR